MELVYQARYFTGKTAHPYSASIYLHEEKLHIHYFDKDEQIELIWEKNAIEIAQHRDQFLSLKYGQVFPKQLLEITDTNFIEEFRKFSGHKKWFNVKLTSPVSIIGLIAVFGLSLWLSYIFLLPTIADSIAKSFPKEYEISMGESLYKSVLAGEEIDSVKTKEINHFFNQLEIKKSYPVKITVVKSKVVNAFALPGGGIVVYDELLNKVSSADQLAALLAHEYGHVEKKHATRNLFRTLSGYIFISVLFSDLNSVANVIVENANQLRNLSYSRELESEADNYGLLILKENNLSGAGMQKLFELFKEEGGSMEVDELLSTHPDLDSRIENANQFVKNNTYTLSPSDSLIAAFNEIKN